MKVSIVKSVCVLEGIFVFIFLYVFINCRIILLYYFEFGVEFDFVLKYVIW